MANEMTQKIRNENLTVLSSAVEFGSQVVLNIAGNEISNHLDGQEITLPFVQSAFLARLKAELTPQTILAAGD